MTLFEIQEHIQRIQFAADEGDFESAHFMQDVLTRTFIEAVAKGGLKRSATLAREVLKVHKIRSERFCA